MASTPNIGLHFSSGRSCSLNSSTPGGCKIDMQTLPSGYTIYRLNSNKTLVICMYTIRMPHF